MELTRIYYHWPFRPFADRLARRRFFNTREWRSMRYGVFSSFAEARAFCDQYGVTAHYDLDHEWWRKQQAAVRIHDYPVLLRMSRVLTPQSRIADLGGSVGVSYFALKPELPTFAQWRVCELPEVIGLGRKLAQERGASDLYFTDQFNDLDDHDVLLTAGAVQYIERPMHELLLGLKHPPAHILINRLPVHREKGDFVTLENTGAAITPCRVVNEQGFLAAMGKAGYEKRDGWYCHQSLYVPLHPELCVHSFMGYYFVRRIDPIQSLPQTAADDAVQFGRVH